MVFPPSVFEVRAVYKAYFDSNFQIEAGTIGAGEDIFRLDTGLDSVQNFTGVIYEELDVEVEELDVEEIEIAVDDI